VCSCLAIPLVQYMMTPTELVPTKLDPFGEPAKSERGGLSYSDRQRALSSMHVQFAAARHVNFVQRRCGL